LCGVDASFNGEHRGLAGKEFLERPLRPSLALQRAQVMVRLLTRFDLPSAYVLNLETKGANAAGAVEPFQQIFPDLLPASVPC
jgi:hypothetical protein